MQAAGAETGDGRGAEGDGLRIAVEGCCHGALDKIYEAVLRQRRDVDLLLVCGDVQALRGEEDYASFSVKPKYRALGDFWQYYTGRKVAPVLTIVIGGNHEASNFFHSLYYGGWIAPNIYYLGAAGVVRVGPLRIAGVSGIFKPQEYRLGHYEMPPYDRSALHTVYHVREYEIFRLAQLQERVDIFLSHDWPAGIDQFGATQELLRRKPYFTAEVQRGELGSPPSMQLLHLLQPDYWFAAHLHVRFEAWVRHSDDTPSGDGGAGGEAPAPTQAAAVQGLGEAQAQADSDACTAKEEEAQEEQEEKPGKARVTRFLALDKCLPRRKFLEFVHIPGKARPPDGQPLQIRYDPEWLTIVRNTHALLPLQRAVCPLPEQWAHASAEDREWVESRLSEFCGPEHTVFRCPTPLERHAARHGNHNRVCDPQTDILLTMLDLPHMWTQPCMATDLPLPPPPPAAAAVAPLPLLFGPGPPSGPPPPGHPPLPPGPQPQQHFPQHALEPAEPAPHPLAWDPNEVDLDDVPDIDDDHRADAWAVADPNEVELDDGAAANAMAVQAPAPAPGPGPGPGPDSAVMPLMSSDPDEIDIEL